jgi:hypothetical protein
LTFLRRPSSEWHVSQAVGAELRVWHATQLFIDAAETHRTAPACATDEWHSSHESLRAHELCLIRTPLATEILVSTAW